MSAVVTTERPADVVERPQRKADGPPLFDDGVRLEDAILGLWEDVVVEGRAGCPVCGGSMAAAGGHAACADCGAELR